MKAILYPSDEAQPVQEIELDTITYEEGLEPDLEHLYRVIGCKLVQLITTADGDLWIDEEGKLRGAPLNRRATDRWSGILFPGDYLAGNVVLVPYVTS